MYIAECVLAVQVRKGQIASVFAYKGTAISVVVGSDWSNHICQGRRKKKGKRKNPAGT